MYNIEWNPIINVYKYIMYELIFELTYEETPGVVTSCMKVRVVVVVSVNDEKSTEVVINV